MQMVLSDILLSAPWTVARRGKYGGSSYLLFGQIKFQAVLFLGQFHGCRELVSKLAINNTLYVTL